jgi:hypothetical protein
MRSTDEGRGSKPGKLPVFRVVRRLISAGECEVLLKLGAESGRYYRDRPEQVDRAVAFRLMRGSEAPWVRERLTGAFKRENIWELTTTTIAAPLRIQRYGRGGYTGPHTDYDYATGEFSKITAVVPLVSRLEWKGGDLLIGNGLRCPRLDRGDCVLFPSMSRHEVTRVSQGTRVVLTAWMDGPPLR